MVILNKLEKQTDNKFLNLYKANYINKETGKDFDYFIATRRKKEDMSCKSPSNHALCDAVMIIPKTKDDELVLIKQFRPAVNDYLYEFPAGLVDPDESIYEAVRRELKEETGLSAEIIAPFIDEPSYNSAGMTDESLCIYSVTASGNISLDNKEENEDIKIVTVPISNIEEFYEKNKCNIALKTKMILLMMIQANIAAKIAIHDFVDTILEHNKEE